MQAFQMGMFGNPQLDPKAAEWARQMFQFPNMSRAMKPGGVDAVTANQALGKVIMGTDPQTIPFFEPYKMPVWLDTIGNYIAAPEFLMNDPQVQQNVVALYERAKQFAQLQMVSQAAQSAQIQTNSMTATVTHNPVAAMQMQSALHPPAPAGADGEPSHPGPATPGDMPQAKPASIPPAPMPPA
jgi:hypothetical protein